MEFTSEPILEQEQARLLWQCRRGMLELDLLLIPFAKKYYAGLSLRQQEIFRTLLSYPDPVVFAWLMGHESPNEQEPNAQELIEIVQRIRRYHTPTPL